MSAQSQIFNPTLRTSQASGEGFACPTMNTASRLAIVFGASDRGMMVYDTTLSNVMFWNGAVWVPLGGGGLVPVGASLNTEVIYNNAGVLEGDTGLTFNNVTNALTIVGPATVQGLVVGKGAGADSQSTAFGNGVLANRTIAVANTGFGNSALAAINSGNSNTAFGNTALYQCQTGVGNVAVGSCLGSLISGVTNTAIGQQSLAAATGNDNAACGSRALTSLQAGISNTACGANAGDGQISGSNNGFFGFGAVHDLNTDSNRYHYGNATVASHKFRTGNVVLGAGNVVLAIAQGIDFSATAGIGTSELLNDYEEGTWTPTDSSGAVIAITGTMCRYTKIGRAVTIQGRITFPANASPATALIGGLPFAIVDFFPVNVTYIGSTLVSYLLGFAGSNFYIYNNTGTPLTNATLTGADFYIGGTYMT